MRKPRTMAADAGLESLRAAAAIAVVILHVAAGVLLSPASATPGSAAWLLADLIDAACRWSVPVFVMISGALLLGCEEAPATFLRRRLGRVLPLLLVWGLLYQGLAALTDAAWTPAQALRALLRGEPAYHLWYLCMLPGLYLMTPWLRRALQAGGRRGEGWLLLAALACTFAAWLLPPAALQWLRAPAFLGAYVGGHLLYRALRAGAWPARVPPGLCVVTWALCSVLIARAAAQGVAGAADVATGLARAYDYANPLVLLQAAAVFVLLLRAPQAWLCRLAPWSLGIYLIHPAVLLCVTPLLAHGGAPAILPLALLVAALSTLAITALARLPGAYRWLG